MFMSRDVAVICPAVGLSKPEVQQDWGVRWVPAAWDRCVRPYAVGDHHGPQWHHYIASGAPLAWAGSHHHNRVVPGCNALLEEYGDEHVGLRSLGWNAVMAAQDHQDQRGRWRHGDPGPGQRFTQRTRR